MKKRVKKLFNSFRKEKINHGFVKTLSGVRTLNRLLKLTEEERKTLFKTKNSERKLDKQQRKHEQVEDVRQLKKSGYNCAEIARMTGLSRQTVKKYTDDNFQIEHASLGVKRGGKLSPYKKEIQELFEKSCG